MQNPRYSRLTVYRVIHRIHRSRQWKDGRHKQAQAFAIKRSLSKLSQLPVSVPYEYDRL